MTNQKPTDEDVEREAHLAALRVAVVLSEHGRLGDRELLAISLATYNSLQEAGLEPTKKPN